MRKKRPTNDRTCNGGACLTSRPLATQGRYWTSLCALVTRRGLRFRHAGHHAGLPGERGYGVPNAEDERLSHAVHLMDSDIRLAQAAAVCMVSERALRTRWNLSLIHISEPT